ncbi:ROK family transcriptional regulator [Nonomuraea sp. SMC257]|uniref:ROK family transcriptional regulator n=1 Tax=Nonomuraea montanisoli TaxID=2741721 RepID=A0A7Y6IFW2_9ACTN|nr:ROK family transcriptional regulator [Nonomuraea montanisoli]NUW37406.1 ROK family transcriptional regulator [Nonomuraea montanisoli]
MREQSGDASLLRKLNSAAVLRILREAGVATLSELARAARVSRPTAEVIVEDLIAEGWAEECGEEQGDRQRGRPARRFRFRASAGHVAGVGIGASHVRAMVADLNGEVVASHKAPTHETMTAAERLDVVAGLVSAVADGAGLSMAGLAAVGVGTTGVVDNAGRVVKSTVLPGWTGLDLRGELGRRLAPPVLVENDMRLAVLAEHWRGVARGHDDVVYLFTGHRLGLALLIGGRPHRGAHAAAGEIGRQARDHWSAFRHVFDYALESEPGELRSHQQAADFAIARARGGDERALAAVTAFARHLGEGLLTLVNPLDPEMVVVGGRLARAGDLLVEPIQHYFDQVCYYPPKVVASGLGSDCVTLGAVRWALDRADDLLFS